MPLCSFVQDSGLGVFKSIHLLSLPECILSWKINKVEIDGQSHLFCFPLFLPPIFYYSIIVSIEPLWVSWKQSIFTAVCFVQLLHVFEIYITN